MIELTVEQRRAVARHEEDPPRALNPDTNTMYVLVREDVYNRAKMLFAAEDDNQFLRDLYPQVMKVFGRDGWDDPAMDVYNELDPRKPP